jgi:hypothetical protein
MKKRILATLVGAFIVVNTFAGDMVSYAEENNEIVEVAEEAETAEVAEEATGEATEDDAEDEAKAADDVVSETVTYAFEQSKVVGDTRINMSAAEGVFPEGAYFEAVEITGNKAISSIEDAVESELSAKEEVVKVKAFDITVYNKDGEEIQPNTDAGNVSVTFEVANAAECDAIKAFHVDDSLKTAERVSSSVDGDNVSIQAEHFSVYAVVAIEDGTPAKKDEEHIVKEVKVLKKDGSELASGDSVKFNTELSVQYIFNDYIWVNVEDAESLEDKGEKNAILSKGKTYQLPKLDLSSINATIPDEGLETEITFEGETKPETAGWITIDKEGNVKLLVNEKFEHPNAMLFDNSGKSTIEPFVVRFTLSKEAVADNVNYDLNLFGKKYSLTVLDNKAEAPTITTVGALSENNEKVTWTTTIKNNSNPKEYSSYTFVGELGGDQILDKTSFTFNGTKIAESDSNLVILESDGKTIIKYIVNPADNTADKEIVVTYETTVDYLANGGLTSGSSKTAMTQEEANTAANSGVTLSKKLTNDVKLTDVFEICKDDNYVNAEKALTKKFLTKTLNGENGKFVKDESTDKGVGSWTITVRCNGFGMKEITVYDDLIPGDDKTSYHLQAGSIEVFDKDGNILDTSKYTLNTTGTSEYDWSITFEDTGADDVYTINYKTEIDNYSEYLRTNHKKAPSNKAWMKYKYYPGNGTTPVEIVGPTMEVKSTIITDAGISAKGTDYNRATHKITYHVVVNQEDEALTEATVEATFPNNNQKFISTTADKNGATNVNLTDGKLTIKLADSANNKKVEFDVVTELKEEEFNNWSKNQSDASYNCKFELTATELDGNTQESVATQNCPSTVITKTAGKYDYVNHTIDYTIVVNENKMLMSDIVVTDNLKSSGLELVEVDSALPGSYTYSDGILTVNVNAVDSAEVGTDAALRTIKFTAKVSDETLKAASEAQSEPIITNNAALITSVLKKGNEQTSSISTKFNNRFIKKDGEVNQNDLSAKYVVTFNANQLELPANTKVIDTLGKSMSLDVSSVKLYYGVVDKGTGLITSDKSEANQVTDVKVTTDTVNDKTVLTVELGDSVVKNKPFYLTYTAFIEDISKNDFSNEVQIVASGMKSYSTASSKAVINALAACKGKFSQAAQLVIIDVDAEDESIKLGNSVFEIYDGDVLVRKMTTKAGTGKATAVGGKIKDNTTYRIVQKEVKNGYEIVTEREVTISGNNAVVNIKNPRKSVKVDVTALDKDSQNKLDDVGIEIRKNNDTPQPWNSKDENAKNVSLTWGNEYTITNTSVPDDTYKKDDAIKLNVVLQNDGSIKVEYKKGNDNYVALTPNDDGVYSTKVECKKKEETTLKIDNLFDEKYPIEGSKFVISTDLEGKDVKDWLIPGSTKTESKNLLEGDYYIVQTETPAGFETIEPIKFTVTPDKTITVNGKLLEDSKLAINSKRNLSKYSFTLDPKELGIDKDLFEQLDYEVSYVNDAGELEPVPYTTNPETGARTYQIDYQRDYVAKPNNQLAGYDPIKSIPIKVVSAKSFDENGNATSTTPVTSLQTKSSLNNNTYSPISEMKDLGTLLQPKLTPVVVNNGSSSTTNNYYYGPAKTTTDDLKEKDITALADANVNAAAAANGAHLAKTGGFIGTLTGYLAAVMMILVGLYLVFGKRKRA